MYSMVSISNFFFKPWFWHPRILSPFFRDFPEFSKSCTLSHMVFPWMLCGFSSPGTSICHSCKSSGHRLGLGVWRNLKWFRTWILCFFGSILVVPWSFFLMIVEVFLVFFRWFPVILDVLWLRLIFDDSYMHLTCTWNRMFDVWRSNTFSEYILCKYETLQSTVWYTFAGGDDGVSRTNLPGLLCRKGGKGMWISLIYVFFVQAFRYYDITMRPTNGLKPWKTQGKTSFWKPQIRSREHVYGNNFKDSNIKLIEQCRLKEICCQYIHIYLAWHIDYHMVVNKIIKHPPNYHKWVVNTIPKW